MELTAGAKIDRRYVVVRSLGRGGMADVWLVRHQTLHTHHALKVLRVPTTALGERLLREGRAQAGLHHPNVVRVTDLIDVDGAPGLLLEYVSGPSLKELLEQRTLTLVEADAVFRGVAAGVAAAHAAGLVHRDLKPANVLLQPVPGGVVPKVTDFGLAKSFGGGELRGSLETRSGVVLGTPAYMAPEQIRDARSVDHRADLFSLAAIGYELLAGARAFVGDDPADVMMNVKAGRTRPLADAAPEATPSMREAIAWGLQPDPEQRPSDCASLLALWSRDRAAIPSPDTTWTDALSHSGAEIAPIVLPNAWRDPIVSGSTSESTYAEPAAPPPVPPALPPRRIGGLQIAAGLALFVAGIGLGTLVPRHAQQAAPPSVSAVRPGPTAQPPLATPQPGSLAQRKPPVQPRPPLSPAPAPSLEPGRAAPGPVAPAPPLGSVDLAQLSLHRLNLQVTDLTTDALDGREDLDWLEVELPAAIADIEHKAERIVAAHPDHDAALGARFQSAMVRYHGWTWRRYARAPGGLDEAQQRRWEETLPALQRQSSAQLDQALEIFEALVQQDHPAKLDSTWPRAARMMIKSIEQLRETDTQEPPR